MKRTAQAHWAGNLKEGKGILSTQSGILNKVNYSYKARFEEEQQATNPEELLAAAHAGCFTMSVAAGLTKKGITPTSLDTTATLLMEQSEIVGIHLSITGNIEGISLVDFTAITKEAERKCIISKALFVLITSEAHLATIKTEKMK